MADLRDLRTSSDNRPWRATVLAIVIVLLTVLAYWPALNAGYIWDDDMYVTGNTLLRDAEGLRRIWVPRQTPQYYPAVFTTFWLEHKLWGLNPRGFHATNILLHAINALLVWRLARLLRIPGAWLVGAVFAVHTVHVESVAWITERKNVLSGLFYLSAALAYLRFDDGRFAATAKNKRASAWGWYAAALVLFLLALLSKSVTCSLPAALILMMLWQRKRLTLARLAPLAPMFIMGLALGLHTAMLERDHVLAQGPDFQFTAAQRVIIASRALLFYPAKVLWPHPLSFIYERWSIDAHAISSYAAPAAVMAIGVAAAIGYARGWRGVPLALAFFVGTIFPALGFFNVYPMLFSFVADHFQYLASLGIIVILVALAARALRDDPARVGWLGAVVLPILIMLTWRQATAYHSSYTIWRDTLSKNPRAWIAHNNIVPMLLMESETALAGNRPHSAAELAREARAHAEAAVALKDDYPPNLSNLSEALRCEGRFQDALAPLLRAIALVERTKPNPDYHWQVGRLHELLRQPLEASESYRTALTLDPDSILFRTSLAKLLLRRHEVAEAQHHFAVMMEQARDPLRQPAPSDPLMLESLATALQQAGQADSAAQALQAAAHLAERLASPGVAQRLRERAASITRP